MILYERSLGAYTDVNSKKSISMGKTTKVEMVGNCPKFNYGLLPDTSQYGRDPRDR